MAGSAPDPSPHPHPQPQPLTAAARGFVQLAEWFIGLAGEQAVDVAKRIDEDRFDASGAVARAAALPLIGWAAFVNEVLDAAGVILHPPQRVRQATSADFVGPGAWVLGQQLTVSPLKNGFDEPLPDCVEVALEPETVSGDRRFKLRATSIPHQCVGVYEGNVGPIGPPDQERISVWLVIP
jgi:hypothetical protein